MAHGFRSSSPKPFDSATVARKVRGALDSPIDEEMLRSYLLRVAGNERPCHPPQFTENGIR